jgi:hypothetical protein
MSEQKEKKFIDVIELDEWEIETDSGWADINRIGKTIPYEKWILKTESHELSCADEHIVFLADLTEIHVKDLVPGDLIMTQSGPQSVVSIQRTCELINMYDLEVNHSDHRYWTEGILSHNTLWLGNLAAQAVKTGHNVAVITLEMNDRKYVKRLGANLLGIPVNEYQTVAEDEQKIKKRIQSMTYENLKVPGKLFVKEFPTSQASVLDLEKYLRKVEEQNGFKFKIVIVDYINILKNWRNPNSENTYMKIKQIAEDLRGVAMSNEWSILTATQTKQTDFDATDLSINSAAESSGLVATVDGLFGIIQDPLMYANREYKLKLIANRDDGYKNAYKMFNVDYSYMRIVENSVPMHTEG